MSHRSITVLAVSLLVLAGCSTIQVSEDFDRGAPFNTYKTFGWMPKPEKMPESARAAVDQNPLLGKRIKEITDEILADKGMTLAQENPDVLINYYVGFKERVDITGWGYWYGPRWGYYWPYLGPYDDYTYTQGTLILDFVDAKTHELIWRGIGDKAIDDYYYGGPANRNFNDRELWRILTKMLDQYPPSRGYRRQY